MSDAWIIDIELPWPPTLNNYRKAGTVRGKARILPTTAGKEYKNSAMIYCCSQHVAGLRLPGRLQVEVTYHPPSKRAYDVDNFLKPVFDSLTSAGVWLDDEQVDRLVVEKGEKIKHGQIRLKIKEA